MAADIKVFQELMHTDNYIYALSLGLVAGVSSDVKFGHTPDVASGVVTDVWENGLAQPVYLFPPDAGDGIEIFSSTTDTQLITVEGLSPAGSLQTETVALSGTATSAGAVAVPGLWRAVNRAFNSDSVDLTGQVTVRKVGDATRVYGLIDIDDQQTSQTPFVVPVDKVALINNFSTAVNKSGGATVTAIFAFKMQMPGKVFRTQIRYGLQRTGTSNISSDLLVPVLAGPLTKVKVTATPDANTTDISAEFSMWLIDKELVPASVLAELG